MLRRALVALILWLGILPAPAQNLDQLSGTVVLLTTRQVQTVTIGDKRFEVFLRQLGDTAYIPQFVTLQGTGFLVVDGNNLFLITAQHVASTLAPDSTVTLRGAKDDPIAFDLTKLIGSTSFKWVFHDKEDVATILLHPSQEVLPLLAHHFISKAVLNAKLEAPSREQPLTTLGFPLGLGAADRFSPISRDFKAVSGLVTLPRPDNHQPATFFLLDSPSVGGFSGAPLFAVPSPHAEGGALVFGGALSCVGLITETISDNTGGKMAAVVPAAYIVETMARASAVPPPNAK